MRDSRTISLMKAFSWRIFGTSLSWVATYCITGDAQVSTTVSALEVLLKTGTFYVHERLWQKWS